MDPRQKIELAIERLTETKAGLEAKIQSGSALSGFESEYVSIIDQIIKLMQDANGSGGHWFSTHGGQGWDNRDRWKYRAREIADVILKDIE